MRTTRFCLFCTLAFLGTAIFATGQTYKVLYNFGANGPNDGSGPMGKLVRDGQGNLYGTTSVGGSVASGTVFELSPSVGGTWTETILYNFCSQANCLDGAYPAGLVFDQVATCTDRPCKVGVSSIWALSLNSPRHLPPVTRGRKPCCGRSYDGDGCFPRKVIFGGAGHLYGTTGACGVGPHPSGTVFELSPPSGGAWTETLLYTFNGTNKVNPYGSDPVGGVTFDNAGNIYGTTSFGGKLFGGTVYELTPTSSGPWTETVLHAFDPESVARPLSSVEFDQEGNLYGTASEGGSDAAGCTIYGCGGIFKLTNVGGQWIKSSLSFTGLNGGNPAAGLILDEKHKTAYGTTQFGGANANGAVFSAHGATVNVLYSFCSEANCTDGSQPLATVTPDGSGNLYGTTSVGGAYNQGVVFEISH